MVTNAYSLLLLAMVNFYLYALWDHPIKNNIKFLNNIKFEVSIHDFYNVLRCKNHLFNYKSIFSPIFCMKNMIKTIFFDYSTQNDLEGNLIN